MRRTTHVILIAFFIVASSSRPVQFLHGKESISPQVSAGFTHATALDCTGTVWTWGDNDEGQLGNGKIRPRSEPPRKVRGPGRIVKISVNGLDTFALGEDGMLWTWGRFKGPSPTKVEGLDDVVHIAAGYVRVLALKRDGSVWTWPHDNHPAKVANLSNIKSIGAGSHHFLAVREDGTLWTWGGNRDGQLGTGDSLDSDIPKQVAGLSDVISASGGLWHSAAVRNDGTVWIWGANNHGQLGNGRRTTKYDPGSIEHYYLPAQVSGLNDIVTVSANYDLTAALQKDGSVWVWGGINGEWFSSLVPTKIAGMEKITKIAAGTGYVLGLKSDFTLWGVGSNATGQLAFGGVRFANDAIQLRGPSGKNLMNLCLSSTEGNR